MGFMLPLLILIIIVNFSASLVPSFQIYGKEDLAKHEQRTLNYIKEHNLISYWAHPEASDHHEFTYLNQNFRVQTEPYPHLLKNTYGYNGFGGVYQDRTTLTDPGSEWDQILIRELNNKTITPVWCFGEMLYHHEGQAGKKLGDVETVVWANEKTSDAILDSIRKGYFYARVNHGNQKLILQEWQARWNPNGTDVSLFATSNTGPEPVRILLISNGTVIKDILTNTPIALEFNHEHSYPKAYYRAVITGQHPLKLVTNPIFSTMPNHKESPIKRLTD